MAEEGKRKSVRKKNQTVNLDTLGLEMGNKPPQALDVEEAVLGALLIEPNCLDEAMEELSPSCFYSEKHRMIFEAMRSLNNEHVALDLLSVSQKLKAQGNLENIGYCKPGHECIYNIYIMEEVQSIIALGAGGSTKLVSGDRIERVFNVKEVSEYIKRIDEMIERKEKLMQEFC